jgi:hypothetical protein
VCGRTSHFGIGIRTLTAPRKSLILCPVALSGHRYFISRGSQEVSARAARKPNPVPPRERGRQSFIWPPDHSRGLAVYPRASDGPPLPLSGLLSYSTLLRVGFAMPFLSPGTRCALTAPFHPYPRCRGRYVFCGTFRRVAPPSRYEAHRPVEFGLSSIPVRKPRLPVRLRRRPIVAPPSPRYHALFYTSRPAFRSPPVSSYPLLFASGCGCGAFARPSISRSLRSRALRISGCSRRNTFAFSRPWPRRSPL